MLIWGGQRIGPASGREPLADGAAYDPTANRWRQLAPAPITDAASAGAVGVWTGREMLVLGDGDAAAYDPLGDVWRRLPDPPDLAHAAQAVWTGREMVVWGGHRQSGFETVADGAAYDPATDRWRPVPRRSDRRPLLLQHGVDRHRGRRLGWRRR